MTQGGGWAAILEAAATDAKAAVAAHPAMSIGSTLKTLATVKAARTAAKVVRGTHYGPRYFGFSPDP